MSNLVEPGSGAASRSLVIFSASGSNFQSMSLRSWCCSTIPAVVCGVIFMLLVTRTTLNVQSFMEAIMAIGVASRMPSC